MADSKKEQILDALEAVILTIQKGASITLTDGEIYKYKNSISYVDRQYLQFEEQDVLNHPRPWMIINNVGELFGPLPSRVFENKILIEMVGFVETTSGDKNLDSIMNSLQQDLFIAILNNVSLTGQCDFILPLSCLTVSEMCAPYGAFVFKLEITYHFKGTNL